MPQKHKIYLPVIGVNSYSGVRQGYGLCLHVSTHPGVAMYPEKQHHYVQIPGMSHAHDQGTILQTVYELIIEISISFYVLIQILMAQTDFNFAHATTA